MNRAWIAAIVGAVLIAVGFITSDRTAFFSAWLFTTLFLLSFPLGALGLSILHQLTSGGWGDAAAPIFRAAIRTLPFVLLPCAIALFGLDTLYPWAGEQAAHDPLLHHKAAYLNPMAFLIRSAVYFAIYLACAYGLERARRQNQTWMFAGPALVLYGLTSSFFAIDWGMSLEPHWYSTIYPMIVIVGHGIAALALALVMLWQRPREEVTINQFHDLGKLLFAFLMLWGYTVFSQLLIIWSGNLAEEAPWYLHRTGGVWEVVAIALFAFGFVVPFLGLLSKEVKRNVRLAGFIAGWLLAIRLLENAWFVLPAFEDRHLTLFDAGVPLLLVGAWLAIFFRFLERGDV